MTKTRAGAKKDRAPKKGGDKEVRSLTDYGVTAEQFIEAWQTSETVDEVCEKLKMPKPIVHARASGYREKGVLLKKMKRYANRGLDVDGLNALIARLNKKNGVEEPEPAAAKAEREPDQKDVQAVVAEVLRTLGKK